MPPKKERIFNYKIKKFNMNKIKRERIVAVIGRRGTGKSTLIEDICYYVRTIPMATVICRTKEGRKAYARFIPESYIHERFSNGVVSDILTRQESALDAYDQGLITNPYNLLIMDDCLADAKVWAKDENIQHIFFNGRHDKLMFIFAMQYSLGIPPDLRNQIDYVFLLKENKITNRKRLFDHYAGMFPSFDVFCKVFDEFTNNFECLVIDNTVISNNIEEMVFWYKADIHEPFTLGCKSYWKRHALKFNSDHQREELKKQKQLDEIRKQHGFSNRTVLIERRYD